jgi:hypothetical protein
LMLVRSFLGEPELSGQRKLCPLARARSTILP